MWEGNWVESKEYEYNVLIGIWLSPLLPSISLINWWYIHLHIQISCHKNNNNDENTIFVFACQRQRLKFRFMLIFILFGWHHIIKYSRLSSQIFIIETAHNYQTQLRTLLACVSWADCSTPNGKSIQVEATNDNNNKITTTSTWLWYIYMCM